MPLRPNRAQSINEIIVIIIGASILLFAIGTMIHRGISADVKKMSETLADSTNTLKAPKPEALPECTCNPPQGSSGWHCGLSPCGITERLITTACVPAGCGAPQGIKEQECVQDSQCCDEEFRDTDYCGTGGATPDCPIGSRITQKKCGLENFSYECRPDLESPELDGSPSCQPKCLGNFSSNEAAAIAFPNKPIICPGDDADLESSPGPWVRESSSLFIQSKILGSGVTACNHETNITPDGKCELYCLNGYKANPNSLSCDPISCQKDPVILNAVISNEELLQDTTQTYQYTIPKICPLSSDDSYVTFNLILGEATVDLWNNATSNWDSLSTSGDNNSLFESIKLYPLTSDGKYFANSQIKWRISQASGDKDNYFAKITAVECDHPALPQHFTVQSSNETLTKDTVLVRSYQIPKECSPVNESSQISVDVQLINATLQVFDVTANTWTEVATSGINNQQFLSLKYHPLGLENRYFNEDLITWRILKTRASENNFQAGISVADCNISMCSGVPKESWVNVMSSTSSCSPVCASVGMKPGISPEGMSCASGENRPMSGTGIISYAHDCASGLGCNGNMSGTTQTHLSDVNCYRDGQAEDGQLTDMTVACYCAQ